MLSKKEIEEYKETLYDLISDEDVYNSIKIAVKRTFSYIDQLEQENNKRNESAYWKGYIQKQNEAMEICKICKYRKKYFKRIEEEAKQYFEKKVEEK